MRLNASARGAGLFDAGRRALLASFKPAGSRVEDAVDAMARKGYDGAVSLGKARGSREGPAMHDETGAGVEQDGRALALRAAYAVVEEHPQQAYPAPAAAPEWEGPHEEGAPALARLAVARNEQAASELQRCWVRRMHQEGALAEAVASTTVIFMVARADAAQDAATAAAAG